MGLKYRIYIGDVFMVVAMACLLVVQATQNNNLVGLIPVEFFLALLLPYSYRCKLILLIIGLHGLRIATVYFGYEHVALILPVFIHNFGSLSATQLVIFFASLILFGGLVFSSQTSLAKCEIIKVNFFLYLLAVFFISASILGLERLRLVNYNIVGNTVDYYLGEINISNTAPSEIAYQKSAANFFEMKKYDSNLKLLIIVESLGYIKSVRAMKNLESILASNAKIIESGKKPQLSRGTFAGEVREICSKVVSNPNLRALTDFNYGDCIPNKLKILDFETTAYHGGPYGIYDRPYFYQKMGFDNYISGDRLNNIKPCEGGWKNAACDIMVLDEVLKNIDYTKKNFVYFLTINSHHPYTRGNANYEMCKSLDIFDQSQCKYYEIIVDLFEAISIGFKGLGSVVYVTGDHSPPGLGSSFTEQEVLPYYILKF